MSLEYMLLVMGMAVVTYVPRSAPLAILAARPLNPALMRWLSFVPASVLAALLLPQLLVDGSGLSVSFDNVFLLAAFPALLVALLTNSSFATVLAGMAVAAGLRALC